MRKLVSSVFAVALVAAACGGGDTADVDAYCELVRNGAGVSSTNVVVRTGELEQLLEVAPADVRAAVLQLRNTTRGLEDIQEVDQLFDAAFDPDAQAAKAAFDSFAVDSCGISEDALPSGRVDSDANLVSDIRSYVAGNFTAAPWVTKVRYEVDRADGALESVTVTFVVPAGGDEARQACGAVSVYLYELRGAEGTVDVVSGDEVVVRRDSPDATCMPA